jgi:phosphatidylethanolamine/phosphatidyl-N-methylethanolamine N-methyltransferase
LTDNGLACVFSWAAILKGSSVLNSLQRQAQRKSRNATDKFDHETRFLRSWIEQPLLTGAVTPSGRMLARTMASYVDPNVAGPVIELGPGTGPVTDALIGRGIEQERLILVEFNPDFCKLLHRRFPRATIIQGDAYDIRATLGDVLQEPAAATVSSLPLFTKPVEMRLALLRESQSLMLPGAPFVQFTYAMIPPIPKRPSEYTAKGSNRVWLNLPPARVWSYRKR